MQVRQRKGGQSQSNKSDKTDNVMCIIILLYNTVHQLYKRKKHKQNLQ